MAFENADELLTNRPQEPLPTFTLCEHEMRKALMLDAKWQQVDPSVRRELADAVATNRYPVYIHGDAGRGKTYAMEATYRVWPLVPTRQTAPYWIDAQPWVDQLMRIKRDIAVTATASTGETYQLTESMVWRRVRDAVAVFIDDIAVRTDSEPQLSVLLQLMNARFRRPCFITGNVIPEHLPAVVGSRTASRMLEGRNLKLTGHDRRMAAGEQVIVDLG